MRKAVPISMVLSMATLALAPAAARGGAPGVFTRAQARHGAEIYAAKCAACHGERMEGIDDAPELASPRFREKWLGRPIDALFTKVRVTMPQDEPGSLRPDEAADLVAVALAMNGLPAGGTALPADPAALRRIRAE